MGRFQAEVVAGTARDYVAAKLAERDERHRRMGDSRYVVEPNVKDGKGGLRDLHTLYWIGKYVFGVESPAELVDKGLFSAAEFRRFERAERFFWSVRCHLHLIAGRGRGAARLRHAAPDRGGDALRRPAGQIGGRALHAILFPEREGGRRPDRPVPRPARRADGRQGPALRPADVPAPAEAPRRLHARSRPAVDPQRPLVRDDPVRLVELFALAAREGLEIHPNAMRAADARCAAGRPGPRRRHGQRLFPRRADRARQARCRAALDERGRRVRPLRARLRPGRRADAVRHVPPLYGRRAFDPRDRPAVADRARRAGRRPSAIDRPVPADRLAPGALRRGAAARHRQGPRRRP